LNDKEEITFITGFFALIAGQENQNTLKNKTFIK